MASSIDAAAIHGIKLMEVTGGIVTGTTAPKPKTPTPPPAAAPAKPEPAPDQEPGVDVYA